MKFVIEQSRNGGFKNCGIFDQIYPNEVFQALNGVVDIFQ